MCAYRSDGVGEYACVNEIYWSERTELDGLGGSNQFSRHLLVCAGFPSPQRRV